MERARLAAAAGLLLAALAPTSARAGGGGYVVTPGRDAVTIAVGAEPADAAARMARPFRFDSALVRGVPEAARALVAARCAAMRDHAGQVGDLFELARGVEADLRAAGYALARVYVPPQRLRAGGALRLEVVDVRVEDLALDTLPPGVAAAVRARFAPVVGRPLLTAGELARLVGLAQLEFGVALRVDTEEGARPDLVRLRIAGPIKAWAAEASGTGLVSHPFQNFLFSGAVTTYAPGDLGGRLALAASAGARYASPDAAGPLWTAGAAWTLPLESGLFLESAATGMQIDSRTRVSRASAAYEFGRLGFRIGAPLLVTSSETLIVKFGPDLAGERFTTRYPTETLVDEVSQGTALARAEVIWLRSFEGGISFEAAGSGALGRTSAREAVRLAGTSASTLSEPAVGILAGRLRATFPLPLESALTFTARAQYSALGRLPISEQFQLFRANDATAYDPETEQGDSGAVGRLELARPVAVDWLTAGAILNPYVFGAAGVISNPLSSGPGKAVTGQSWGAGATLALPPSDLVPATLTLGLELFRQVSTGSVPDYTGLTLRVSAKF